jgi:YYY domain-containing protein
MMRFQTVTMLATLSWWFILQLFSLAVLPLAWRLFARLPGRGYPLAKALGLLLVAYILWLGATLHVLPNSFGGAVVALIVVAGTSWWLGRDGWRRDADGGRPLAAWLKANRWLVLATELLFLFVLVGWAAFRAHNPDIAGTEKPMEFAFVNGILRSPLFPPQDPWLSGYGISYYYFGYVMLAALVNLTGVDPAIAFNLGVALWYALVMIGAFGVVYDLVRLAGRREREAGNGKLETGNWALEAETDAARNTEYAPRPTDTQGRGIRYGLLGALFVGFLGNLEGLVELAYHKSLVPLQWLQWLDIKQLTENPASGNLTGGFWWWWHASRVIHDKDLLGNSIEVIDEFPFFSFLLGDMHPHVLGLPFAILAVALALNLLLGVRSWKPEAGSWKLEAGNAAAHPAGAGTGEGSSFKFRVSSFWSMLGHATGLGGSGIILYALALGALAFLNTWDFPIYVGLVMLALGVGLALADRLSWGTIGRAVAGGIVLAALGWLLYLPFYLGFQSQLGGILPNLLFPSRFSQFMVMFGLFLLVAVFFLVQLTRKLSGRPVLRGFLVVLPFTLLVPPLLLAAVALSMAVLPQGKALVQEVLNNPAVQANVGSPTLGGLIGLVARLRLATPWTWLALAGLIAWAAGVVWAGLSGHGNTTTRRPGDTEAGRRDDTVSASPRLRIAASPDLFAVVMIGLALILTLVPEFVYLRDMFGTRMNTVFKFYYQAWLLLALASAYAVSQLSERGVALWLKLPALILTGLLILGSLWYPLAAIPSKADNFLGEPTLDGLAYLRRNSPGDMAAIAWIRSNVAPDAVVLEATGGSYSSEGAGRISMSTGNPTLLGWDFHERQWRGNEGYDKFVAGRLEVIEQIYRTARAEDLPRLLEQWGVDYVLIGGLERNKYKISEAALARFDAALKLVYDQDGVRIYAR